MFRLFALVTLLAAGTAVSAGEIGYVEDFALAIRENRPPATGLEQALTMMQITDAIYQSAHSGQAVDV